MRTLLLAALDAMVVAAVLWVTGRLVEGMGWSECGRTKWCAIKVAVVSVTDRDTITHQGITPPTIGSFKGNFKLTNPLQASGACYATYKGVLLIEEDEGSVHGRTTRRPCAPLLGGMSHSPKGREVANHFLRGHLHSLLDRLRPPLCFELRLIPGPEARSGCG